MTDLIWAGPTEDFLGFTCSPRGISYCWGSDVSAKFCRINGLKLIACSLGTEMDGYRYLHDEKVIKIFSSPNYMKRVGNSAAVINVGSDLRI